MNKVTIYTDGSCLKNPGPGGWAAILLMETQEQVLQGNEAESTNNRMELMAAIRALATLPESSEVVLYTDSKYVQNGITSWISKWQKNGWRTASKKPVKNVELWQALQAESERHQIDWCWVKGHSRHVYNDRVDQLAKDAIHA